MPIPTLLTILGGDLRNELLSLLLHQVQDYAFILLDPTGQIVSWGRGAELTLGYRDADVLGQSFTMLFTPEGQASGMPENELVRATRDGHATDNNWLVHQDGRWIWVNGASTPLYAADGTLRGFVKIVRDETAQRQAAQEHQRLLTAVLDAHVAAEAAVAARDRLLGLVSHELKTSFTVIAGQAQLLHRRVAAGRVQADQDGWRAAAIVEQVQRMTTMLADLLDVSRLQSGTFTLTRQPLDLRAVLQLLVAEMQDSAGQHQLLLPDHDTPLMVDGDATRLRQIFQNLLTNAVKYSPAGGTITIRATSDATQICVAVQDTGIGIPTAAQAHLFEPFYRVPHVTAQPIAGTGLGLHIVHELVTLHHGTITIVSTEGQGSTFTVCLPRLATADGHEPVPGQPAAP